MSLKNSPIRCLNFMHFHSEQNNAMNNFKVLLTFVNLSFHTKTQTLIHTAFIARLFTVRMHKKIKVSPMTQLYGLRDFRSVFRIEAWFAHGTDIL